MSSAPDAPLIAKRCSTSARRNSSTLTRMRWETSARSIWSSMSSAVRSRSDPQSLIRAGGTLVTIVGPAEARPSDGLAVDFVVEADRAALIEIVQRVRDGRLRTNIGKSLVPR